MGIIESYTGPLVAFLLTTAACPFLLGALTRAGVLDIPSSRSSHSHPVVRGGGAAIMVGTVAGATFLPHGATRTGIAIVAVGAGLVGLVDDLRGVGPGWRLGLQVAVAIPASIVLTDSWLGPIPVPFLVPLTVAWLVAYTNAFNFMDGINGISVAQVATASGCWIVLAGITDVRFLSDSAWILGTASLAFLPYNFPSARMFLGDVGSYFLGASLATLAVIAVGSGIRPEAVLAPLIPYLADTSWTLVRRLAKGEQVLQPHRSHVYQRLVADGMSHAACTGLVTATMLLCASLGVAATLTSLTGRMLCILGLLSIALAYLGAPRFRARIQP